MFDFDELYDYEKQEAEMIANSGQPTYELTFEVTLKRKFRYQPQDGNRPIEVVIADLTAGLMDMENEKLPWRVENYEKAEPLSAVMISNKEVCKHCNQVIDEDDGIACCRRYVREQNLKATFTLNPLSEDALPIAAEDVPEF